MGEPMTSFSARQPFDPSVVFFRWVAIFHGADWAVAVCVIHHFGLSVTYPAGSNPPITPVARSHRLGSSGWNRTNRLGGAAITHRDSSSDLDRPQQPEARL